MDVRVAGLSCINVFVVLVECVKALLVNICYGTAKSSMDTWVSTGQHTNSAGEHSPLYACLDVWGGVLVRDCQR